jgi:hypothetical protein
VSQFFMIGRESLWNPASGVSRVFMRVADALSADVGVPSGVGPMLGDEAQVDLPVFQVFTDTLVSRFYRDSHHPIQRSMTEGFIATALVLLDRAGGTLPKEVEPLLELSREHSGYMVV